MRICTVIVVAMLVSTLAIGSDVQRGFSRGAGARGPLPVKRDGKWGYVDHRGKIIVQPRFEWAEFFYDERAAVQVDGKWGYIDRSGKFQIVLKQLKGSPMEIGAFSDGVALVPLERGLAYISRDGEVIAYVYEGSH